MKNLKDLFLDTLACAYDSEQQIAEASPAMSDAAQSQDLREAIDAHLAETEEHVEILEHVFQCFGEKPRSTRCYVTACLIEEGDTLMNDLEGAPALDAAIMCAAQKIEHYEMASYGSLHMWAGLLGNEEAVDLLAGILQEEKDADATLKELALAQGNDEALESDAWEEQENEYHDDTYERRIAASTWTER